jgi:hypothetical protein
MAAIMGGIVDNFGSCKADPKHQEYTQHQCGKTGYTGRIRPYIGTAKDQPACYMGQTILHRFSPVPGAFNASAIF